MIPLRFQLCCICVTQLRRRRPKPQTVWRGFRRCVCLIQVMPVWFVCFCPASHACHHGHSSLGEFRTENEARNKIVNHLRHSSCHNMSLALAEQMALEATLDEEYREDCDPKGKGKGTVDGAVRRHRHEPYGGEWGGSSSRWTAPQSVEQWSQPQRRDVFAALGRCENAAAQLAQELARLREAMAALL